MISKFFIERPVLANVLAIVLVLIGARRAVRAAGRAISQRRAADRAGDDPLSRRQRADRHRHRRPADRAAGQRRRAHDLHAVDQRERRHLHPDRHLRDRHRPRFRAGAGAEPGVSGAGLAAAGGAGAGRHRAEEVDRDPADRRADLAGRPLRQPVHEQLRHHQPGQRAGAPAGRRQRQGVRRRPVLDADLDGPAEAAILRPDAAGRHPGHPAAEPAGRRRPGRHAAGAGGAGLPVHRRRPGPARRSRAVRQHRRQGAERAMAAASSALKDVGARRARRADLLADLPADGKPAAGIAIYQTPDANALDVGKRGRREDGGAGARLPAGPRLQRAVRHDELRQRPRSTRSSSR